MRQDIVILQGAVVPTDRPRLDVVRVPFPQHSIDVRATIELRDLRGQTTRNQEVVRIDDTLPNVMRSVFQTQREVGHVYLGSRLVRGWAIEFALVAMLLPVIMFAVMMAQARMS